MKILNFFGVALVAVMFLASCGGGGNKKKEVKDGSTQLEVTPKMGGALSDNFEVTNAVLKISSDAFGSKLLVEIKRTANNFSFSINDAQVCGVRAGKEYTYCISADIVDETGIPIVTNLDKYGYDPFEKCLSLNTGETIWLEFSLGYSSDLKENPEKAKKVKLNSSLEKNNVSSYSSSISNTVSSSKSSSGTENWDKILDSYEKYIDQYIKLLKKAQNGDMSAMSEYVEMMEKATDLAEKIENADNDLSTSQMSRFLKLQTKLANAAAGI